MEEAREAQAASGAGVVVAVAAVDWVEGSVQEATVGCVEVLAGMAVLAAARTSPRSAAPLCSLTAPQVAHCCSLSRALSTRLSLRCWDLRRKPQGPRK